VFDILDKSDRIHPGMALTLVITGRKAAAVFGILATLAGDDHLGPCAWGGNQH
jgi:hypothetical protein